MCVQEQVLLHDRMAVESHGCSLSFGELKSVTSQQATLSHLPNESAQQAALSQHLKVRLHTKQTVKANSNHTLQEIWANRYVRKERPKVVEQQQKNSNLSSKDELRKS